MENFQAIYKCVILLALVACHEVLVIEGRQMKSTKQKQYNNIKDDSSGETKKQVSESMINSFDNSAPHQDDPQPTRPSHIPSVDQSVVRKKETVPPMIPNNSISFRDSDSAYKNDFRPTAPGNSPGVGHSFPNHEADVDQLKALGKSQRVNHPLTGFKDDYRPTAPGHSPGVGHVLQNTEPNS